MTYRGLAHREIKKGATLGSARRLRCLASSSSLRPLTSIPSLNLPSKGRDEVNQGRNIVRSTRRRVPRLKSITYDTRDERRVGEREGVERRELSLGGEDRSDEWGGGISKL